MAVLWRVAVLAAGAALLCACGNEGYQGKKVATLLTDGRPPPTEQPAMSDEDKFREFEKCMADNGVEFPKSAEEASDWQPDEEKMRAADEACRHLLPHGGQPPPLDPKSLDEMRNQAKCLRDHGIDVADPDPNNPYLQFNGTMDEEAMRKAMEACMGVSAGPGGAVESAKPEPAPAPAEPTR